MPDPTSPPPPSFPHGDGLPLVSPDAMEEIGDEMDNIIPTSGYQMTPMVALGGSAGSIQALQRFFQNMPAESGIVFVVILHLSPEHKSILPGLLAHSTSMRVMAARDGLKVEPNCVYVIPPGKHLTTVDGHLRLDDLQAERGRRVAVDLFFRSLADTHGPHAAVVVLSGADSDGAIGLKRIKERGGLTISQDPDEAEHNSMPQAAINTGMIDWVLRITEMPGRLLQYFDHEQRIKLPAEEGPPPAQPASLRTEDEHETALREILAFLRTRTGRDFSYYKRATIVRRISRRLQINGLDDFSSYLSFLRTHQGEAGALLQDLLISVTNFFRDREAFTALADLIPRLFEGKTVQETVRVWTPACATGEETYSLAMLLLEHARQLEAPPALQVFGCDLDDQAIQVARAGAYPETIAADVSEERLRRFFTKEHRGYRVRREVREIVLFAQHDLLKDAPFSRLDLISCRNLLIYLNRDAQRRVMEIFHFALRPQAWLFLGASETVEDGTKLFETLDRKYRLFRQRLVPRLGAPVPAGSAGPGTLLRALEAQEKAKSTPVLPRRGADLGSPLGLAAERGGGEQFLTAAELHFRLLELLAPPSIVVNSEHEIIHLSENAGRFLQFSGGEPTRSLLRMVHPMLRAELRAALFQAAETALAVEVPRVRFEYGGEACAVNLRISSVGELAPGCLLVVFEIAPLLGGEERLPAAPRIEPQPVIRQLEREIESLRASARAASEQYEASTEELKAGNEELQAMNEELRSASEELETSREELQSINEELTTLNCEWKGKVDELAHTNSDLHNLMNATAIATVFLDRELCITRYTPSAVELFNLIPTDVGRPLGDLKRHIDYPGLEEDAARVIEQLVPVEREVGDHGKWFLTRLLPYRTLDDRIAGVVLTLVEVTERKRHELNIALLDAIGKDLARLVTPEEMMQTIGARVAAYLQLSGCLFAELDTTKGEVAMHHGWTAEPEPPAFCLQDYLTDEFRRAGRAEESIVVTDTASDERVKRRNYAELKVGAFIAIPVFWGGRWVAYGAVTHVTPRQWQREEIGLLEEIFSRLFLRIERARTEETLRLSEEQFRAPSDALPALAWRKNAAGKDVFVNRHFLEFTGKTALEIQEAGWQGLLHPEDFDAYLAGYREGVRAGRPWHQSARLRRHDGAWRWHESQTQPLLAEDGTYLGEVGIWLDVTERVNAETALRTTEERFRAVANLVPDLLWSSEADGSTNWYNQRWLDYTGQTFAQAMGWGWTEAIHPDDRPNLMLNYREAIEHARPLQQEYRIRRVEGAYRWHLVRVEPLCAAPGCPRRMYGAATDVHDARVGTEALRASEERFRIAMEAAEMAAWDYDVRAGTVIWNEQHYRILGLEPQTAAQTPEYFLSFVHPEDLPLVKQRLLAAVETGGIYRVEFRMIRADNQAVRWMSGFGKAMASEGGAATRMSGIMLDVTERQEAEEALTAMREHLRLIVESAHEHAIISLDLERRVKSWNPGAEAIFGYTQGEVMGQSADVIFTSEDRAAGVPVQEAETALEQGRAGDNRWHLRRDGSRLWANGAMLPMRAQPGGAVIGLVKILRDETPAREAREALEQSQNELWKALQETERARGEAEAAQARAEAAGEAKDHFLAVLSHELRTPLTPIVMATQILARRKDLPEPMREALSMIQRNIQLESRLVDDLLDVTKIERGKMELMLGPVELHVVIHNAVETTRSDIEGKGQQLILELASSAQMLHGDANRLQQVVWNLLKNASKFTPAGGEIRIRTRTEQNLAVIEVSDTGIGIEAEALPKIFRAFTQASASITRQFGGLGLGLAIAHAIVLAHGGELRVASEGLDRGAVFTVLLPVSA